MNFAIIGLSIMNSKSVQISDVDLSLLQINLKLTYEQRIQKNDDALNFINDLRKASQGLNHATARQSARLAFKRQD